ncbi:MAG: hypothetical protein E7284_08455 [Lachnospiraceae bacterium]|nr:hypothetical protein [Lachnospiraceae bacterium]
MREKDITQKKFFEDAGRFADFMNAVCFHGRQILKPEELESSNISMLKADEQAVLERFCDVIKKQTKEGAVYAIYVLENQETVDYGMLVRVMLEESLAYDKQVKEIGKRNRDAFRKKSKEESAKAIFCEEESVGEDKREGLAAGEFLYGFRKTDRLIPIYTIVVYWGEKEWDGAKSLRELIDLPIEDEELRQEMLKRIPDYRIQVYDLNKETDFTAFQTSLKTVFEFYSTRKNKDELRNYMNTHREEVEELDCESKFFLATMLGQKKLRKKLLKKETKKEEGSMCKAIDDMIEEGIQQGIEKGRAEAEQMIFELKEELAKEKEKSNCKAIDDMIEEGIQQGIEKGREEGRAEAEQTISELKEELAKEKEKSNCKAIDDMIEEGIQQGIEKGREEGRAEAEQIITELKEEIEGLKKLLAV